MATNNIEALYKIMMEGKAKNPNFSGDEALAQLMKQRLQEILGDLMGVEMEHFLGFKKNEQGAAKAKGNSRNGSYKRKITSIAGEMQVDVPRDRNAEFETMLFEAHKQNSNKIVSDVLKMYAEGLTETQIQAIIEKIYDKKLSKSCISDMVDVVIEDIQKFQNRPLQEKYFAIFCDSTYVPLRRQTVDKEAINIVIGIDMKGYPEVLAYSITPEECKTSWEDLFLDITKRGVKSSMILISDGFVGISDLVKSYFPGCLHQRCFIHLARNLGDKVRKEDRAAITNEFMYLAKQLDMKHAVEQFQLFIERWSKKYPSKMIK